MFLYLAFLPYIIFLGQFFAFVIIIDESDERKSSTAIRCVLRVPNIIFLSISLINSLLLHTLKTSYTKCVCDDNDLKTVR